MIDVAAVGELLIDFTPAGADSHGNALFCRNPGGAPANVLSANAKLGGSTAFIGMVGEDSFGVFLKDYLGGLGILTKGLKASSDAGTTLAFVHLDENGDRSFSFYRNPGADMMLEERDINLSIVSDCKILHFGSVSLTDEPSRSATLYAVHSAKAQGKIISYDPNYRPMLWRDTEQAVVQMKRGAQLADIIKVSEEELVLLTGSDHLAAGAALLEEQGASLVLVSRGKKGAYCHVGGKGFALPTYAVKTIDTNGAGDAFLGAVHYCLRGKDLNEIRALKTGEVGEIISFANAAGSLATTKKGAITAMPTLEEIKKCQKNIPLLKDILSS